MIDLASKKMLSDKLNPLLEVVLEAQNKSEPKRRYLGGSRIGAECERMLQFEFFNTPKDPGKDFHGRILRIFERGHWAEAAMIEWMRNAGIIINTCDETGKQFNFSDLGGRYKGHCDGIITGGPELFGPFPRLWENKCLKADDWRGLAAHGLRKEKPVYWAQCQVYTDKFKLTENPGLFSAVNADTMEIYWEVVPFNPAAAAMFQAKAERILAACEYGDLLPKLSQDPSFYQCKWCSWQKRCHGIP